VEKVNLALEMGNNVMLYLDDIQHTHPEFLQKFISLCDGSRRIEGVWKGRTRTYDLRGKKFCVIMAGNPYTEAGEKFQIPDMLANRADTYNLGEILDGKDDLFALSYLENAITSNPVLAPLAGRDQEDIYRVIRMAQGEEIPSSEFSHGYSGVELQEIASVLQRLFTVQDVLLKVNQQYIASASMDDDYRTEPPFKLQGSYRNMNKITEKVAAALNEDELQRLVDDHYQSESQTLTTGAEQNLLKLAELRGRMTDSQRERWEAIKQSFARVKLMGGSDDDPVARISGPLSGLADHLAGLRAAVASVAGGVGREPDVEQKATEAAEREALRALVEKLDGALDKLARPQLDMQPLEVQVQQQPLQVVVEQSPLQVELDQRPLQVHVQQPALPIDQLAAVQADLVKQTLLPLVQQAASQMQESQQTSRRLGELLADYLEFEQNRRVRLKPPSKRTKKLESESSVSPPE
jgi:hypothetical protein